MKISKLSCFEAIAQQAIESIDAIDLAHTLVIRPNQITCESLVCAWHYCKQLLWFSGSGYSVEQAVPAAVLP